MNEIPVNLEKKDMPAAAAVLGKAFSDYPLLNLMYPEEERRLAMADTFTSIALRVCQRYGEAQASSGRMEGVAGWLPPGKAPFTFGQIFRSVPISTLLKFGRQGARRVQPFGDFVDRKHRELAPFPHWYLQILGVDPGFQGKGVSSRLLRPMLERIDGEGLPCFVETNTEKNVGIYEHFGFKLVADDEVPGTGLKSYAMLRSPSPQPSPIKGEGD